MMGTYKNLCSSGRPDDRGFMPAKESGADRAAGNI